MHLGPVKPVGQRHVGMPGGRGSVSGTVALGTTWVYSRDPRDATSRWGSCTGASVATVFPALVQLTLIACVSGLAAALGLPPSVEETATAIEALQGAGSRPWGCVRTGTKGQGSQIL